MPMKTRENWSHAPSWSQEATTFVAAGLARASALVSPCVASQQWTRRCYRGARTAVATYPHPTARQSLSAIHLIPWVGRVALPMVNAPPLPPFPPALASTTGYAAAGATMAAAAPTCAGPTAYWARFAIRCTRTM